MNPSTSLSLVFPRKISDSTVTSASFVTYLWLWGIDWPWRQDSLWEIQEDQNVVRSKTYLEWALDYCQYYFPGGANGKEPRYHCRRHKKCRFDPWVGKILWRRAWQHAPIFLPGGSYGQGSLASHSQGPRVRHDWSDLAHEVSLQICWLWMQVLNSPTTLFLPSPHPKISFICLFILQYHVACVILVPWSGIEPVFSALGAWSVHHWTAREGPQSSPLDHNIWFKHFYLRCPFYLCRGGSRRKGRCPRRGQDHDQCRIWFNPAPMDPEACSSPQCTADEHPREGRGRGEFSFVFVFYRKAESGRGSASYERKLHLLTLS